MENKKKWKRERKKRRIGKKSVINIYKNKWSRE